MAGGRVRPLPDEQRLHPAGATALQIPLRAAVGQATDW